MMFKPFFLPAVRCWWSLALVLLALLAGCAQQPTWEASPDARARWEARAPRLAALDDWQLAGRFGFTRHKDAFAASLDWQQSPARYQLALTGPLGQPVATLSGEGDHHRIDIGGRVLTGDSVADLLDKAIGYPLPVEKLRYWIRGLPDPQANDTRTLDGEGRLSRLEDDGWTVDFLHYTRIGDTELPARIRLENRWFTLKIAILDWQLNSAGMTAGHEQNH